MKRNLKKIISLLVCVVMLTAAIPTSFAAKVDLGKEEMGFAGNAIISDVSGNKVLKLENAQTETWSFKTDAGVVQSYKKDIIVSADVKGETGATLTMTAGDAACVIVGTGALQSVELVIYPRAFKYEVFVDGKFVEKKAMPNTAVAAVSSATFSVNGGNFTIDNLKVEQWDKLYADSQLENVYTEKFDGLSDGNLKNNGGWFAYSNYGNVQGTVKHGDSGKSVSFSEKPSGTGTSRYSYTFAPAVAENTVISMWLYSPANNSNKLDIMLRNGTGGDRVGQVFVEQDYLYSYEARNTFTHAWDYDTWFNLKIMLNWDEKVYNLYVDGKKQNDEPIDFATSAIAQFDTILFESVSGTGMWYVDDIEISTISGTEQSWTTVFEDKFENGFSAAKGSASSVANTWYYGSRNSWNPANAIYSAKDITNAGIASSDSAASGKALEIDAKRTFTTSDTDITGANIVKDSNIRGEALVLDLGEGYSKNFRVTMDLYAANYSYKNEAGQESIRRDNLRVAFANNYNYNNGNTTADASAPYVEFENAGVKINTDSDNAYNQNSWNTVAINVDENKIITTEINGKKGAVASTSLTNAMTDLVMYVNYPRAGWWFVDNFKVETLSEIDVTTDLSKGDRELLVQNTIDEMYIPENTENYYVEGLYYTKNKGASFETVINEIENSYILGKAVVVNNTESDLVNVDVFAVVYDGTVLEDAAVKNVSIEAGKSEEIDFTDSDLLCSAEKEVRLFVWENGTLAPITASFDLPVENNNSVKNIFVVSDSLSAPYSNKQYPQAGWGEIIGTYLDQTQVQVVNYGLGGRSSKSFYNEAGCWAIDGSEDTANNRPSIMNIAKPGDWVLLSFAHNDEKTNIDDDGNYIYFTDPYGDETEETSYRYWLNKYYQDCVNKNINLALITPMPRRVREAKDTVFKDSTFLPYVKVMKEFAAENNIPVVDNYNAMKSKFVEIGVDNSADLFVIFNHNTMNDTDEFYKKNSQLVEWNKKDANVYNSETGIYTDNTHTNIKGATMSVEAILRGLSRVKDFAPFILK